MLKIKTIQSHHLRNEAHYEFLVVFLMLLDKFPQVKNLALRFLQAFTDSLEVEKKLVDAARRSIYTKKLLDTDQRIDRDITGIKATIKAARNHFDPALVEAAQDLSDRMKDFGNIKSKAYEEESAAIQVLLRDFRGAFATQVQTIDLNKWVDELEQAEAEFIQLFSERNAELAERPRERLKDVRKEIDNVYRKIITCINTDLILNEQPECVEFANELNERVKYFNEHIHHQTKKDISKAFIESIANQNYTGKQVIVFPTVLYENKAVTPPRKEALVFATDYTLSYKNNIRTGNASLIVHGKGKYKGQKTITFMIVK
jgi:hypothetical protein